MVQTNVGFSCCRWARTGAAIAFVLVLASVAHSWEMNSFGLWRHGQSTEIRTTRHGIEHTSDYRSSPVQYVTETGQWLDIVLKEATDRRFPILATLRAQGITHYVSMSAFEARPDLGPERT